MFVYRDTETPGQNKNRAERLRAKKLGLPMPALYSPKPVIQQRWLKYGLTAMQYDQMIIDQGNKCSICKVSFDDVAIHIDHDHACCPGKESCGGCVRGLLCRWCNYGLGNFKDDPVRLLEALSYLNLTSTDE